MIARSEITDGIPNRRHFAKRKYPKKWTHKFIVCQSDCGHKADRENQKFLKAAHINKLSYIHYLGAKRQLSDYILFARPEPTKRGISARKGGAA